MRDCPSCGYSNVETATVCIQCNRALSGVGSASVTPPEPSLHSADTSPSTPSPAQRPPSTLGATPPPPPPAPIPLRAPPPPNSEHTKQYFQGLGFGLIPLVAFLIVVGIIKSGVAANVDASVAVIALIGCLLLYLAELIIMIVFLVSAERRFIGYGLLTAFLITPIAGSIGCVVIVTSSL
jgi:hypothetical protein